MNKFALVGLAGVVAAMGIAAPGIAGGNKYDNVQSERICSDATGEFGRVVLDGPLKLWPPNHKMIDEPVTATATPKSGNVTITLTPTLTDDLTGGDGGSQHDPDFNTNTEDGKSLTATDNDGDATAGLQLRAERSGKGDGRTYTVNWLAEFGAKSCLSDAGSSDQNKQPFVITVPHDMSGGADWK